MQATAVRNHERHSAPPFLQTLGDANYHAPRPLVPLVLAERHAQGIYVQRFDLLKRTTQVVAWSGPPPASTGPWDLLGTATQSHLNRQAPIVLEDSVRSVPRFEALPEIRGDRFDEIVSIPLLDSRRVAGFLNVCRSSRANLQAHELSFLLGLNVPTGAPLAAIEARLNLEREVAMLSLRLAGRKLVERAKGLIQERFQITEEQIYLSLRNLSRRRRTPMRDIAMEVLCRNAQRPFPSAVSV
jgi:hypothetical protein